MKTHWTLALVFSVFLLNACSTKGYVGVKPVYPPPPDHINSNSLYEKFTVVGSLHPTLQWEPLKLQGYTYDLAVWKKPQSRDVKHLGISHNNPEYYVEGIDGTKHTIADPLLPNQIYMWTVRARKGEEIGKWATYKEQSVFLGGATRRMWNLPFSFKTPEK